jgi:hypothetical protein
MWLGAKDFPEMAAYDFGGGGLVCWHGCVFCGWKRRSIDSPVRGAEV